VDLAPRSSSPTVAGSARAAATAPPGCGALHGARWQQPLDAASLRLRQWKRLGLVFPMPLRWWPRQQGPFPSSGRGMAITRAVLLDDNSDRDPSPLHQQQQRPISTSPACSCRDGSPVAASSGPFPCSSGTAPTRLRSLVDPGTGKSDLVCYFGLLQF
jgi:hypothetical protein